MVFKAMLVATTLAASCAPAYSRPLYASWYGGGERLSSHTASGARFHPGAHTVAHRSLPFGTKLLITHGGRQAICVVNDRGPAAKTGRSLDLARGCAQAVGLRSVGWVDAQRLN